MVSAEWRAIFTVGFVAMFSSAAIELDGNGQSFSSVIKQYEYTTPGEEITLFEKGFSRPGYVTEQWYTGGTFDNYARIRIYLDGENVPSLDFRVTICMAVDPITNSGDSAAWSTRLFGHLANNGGYFNLFRIPFSKGIKITLTNDVTTGFLWYIVRGLVGVKLVVGSWILPEGTRLKVYKQDKIVTPLNIATLSNTTNKAGMLFLVTLDISSATPVFMEGCVRANIDHSNETTFLSSGTEDFFLSAYYFNTGSYEGYQSGLTYKREDGPDDFTKIIAYKFFLDDPILFSKSFHLMWRNNEKLGGADGCPSQFPPNLKGEGLHIKYSRKTNARSSSHTDLADAHLKSYVWVYEW
mgnify:FL=1